MRAAVVLLLLSTGLLLAGCDGPRESVVLSQQPPSVFDRNAQPDGRWRKAHPSRPVAILLGYALTSVILMPRRAALEASCYRGKPRARVAFDIGLRSGSISVAYRFDEKVERTGVTRVRGRSRNIVVIDHPDTAAAFLFDLTASSTLKVRSGDRHSTSTTRTFAGTPRIRRSGTCSPRAIRAHRVGNRLRPTTPMTMSRSTMRSRTSCPPTSCSPGPRLCVTPAATPPPLEP